MKISKFQAAFIAISACALGISLLTVPDWAYQAPPIEVRESLFTHHTSGVWLYDRAQRLLRASPARRGARFGSRGLSITLSEVSPWVGESLICLEDQSFRAHRGVPWRGVARALWVNIKRGRLSVGGSGLTQQLVKLHHRRARSLFDKLSEARWAWWVNRHFSKDEQLERYLNAAPFGNNIRGVWNASRLYFGLPPSQLSLAQASYLAALPRAPTRLDPLRHPERALPRQRAALRCLHARGAISARALQLALETPITPRRHGYPFEAPHLTDYVLRRLNSSALASEQPQATPHNRLEHESRSSSAHRIKLTLDLDVQRRAEAIVSHYASTQRERGLKQVAAVGLDVARGEVLFWVGSADYRSPDAGQVDHALGLRQPGSTLKPFLYALALERGFTLDQMIPDRLTYFKTALGHYRPTNYNHTTRGEVSLMSALAQSLNIPSVWLLNEIGIDPLLQTLRGAGLESLNRDALHYGLGLSLGDGDVRLIDLANAYRGLMRGGLYTPWRVTLDSDVLDSDVLDSDVLDSDVLDSASLDTPRRFLSEAKSFAVIQTLSSAHLRAPSFGELSPLKRAYPSFAKTGTSQGYTNAWTLGGTPRYIVGVWVLPETGAQLSGGVIAAPLWAELLDLLHEEHPPSPLPWRALDAQDRAALRALLRSEERTLTSAPVHLNSQLPSPHPESSGHLDLHTHKRSRERCSLNAEMALEIVAPPHQSRYQRLPTTARAQARIRAEARLSAPCLESFLRSNLKLEWRLDGRLVRDTEGLTAWIRPWISSSPHQELCVIPRERSPQLSSSQPILNSSNSSQRCVSIEIR